MSDMTVGCIRTTVNPPSGIYEALLEKAERERDEAREDAADWKTEYEIVADRLRGRKHPRDNGIVAPDEIIPILTRERDEAREHRDLAVKCHDDLYTELCGASAERDYYKSALEKISTTIQEYKGSMVQEPVEDFILAIKAWADKKLKEL